MRRRRFLAAAGAALPAFLAGCPASAGDERRSGPTETLTAAPVPEVETDVDRRTAPETVGRPLVNVQNASNREAAPAVATPERFEGRDCPPFDLDTDRVLCAHALDPAESPLYLAPTSERVDADSALSLVLANREASTYTISPRDWEIRAAEDDWATVAAGDGSLPLVSIDAGEAYTWTVNLRTHTSSDTPYDAILELDLDPGVYAFVVSGEYGTSRPDSGGESQRVAALALFEVV